MSVTQDPGAPLISAHTLTAAYADAGASGVLGAAASDEAVFFIDYTKGTEATGLHWKAEWRGLDGVFYPLGIDTAGVWTPMADQQLNATGKIAVRLTTPGLAIKFSVKANGALGGGPGTVSVRAVGVGARG